MTADDGLEVLPFQTVLGTVQAARAETARHPFTKEQPRINCVFYINMFSGVSAMRSI